jgi:pimeloyl-ACP methyl ester carboxylesterase
MSGRSKSSSTWTLLAYALVISACVAPALCGQEAGADARATFRAVRRAAVRDGIDADGFVRIGGIDQWISVRGRHKSSPILLFLHGGPGFTSIPTSYYFMSGWDEYFTVVQWDQRGTGKTFGANAADAVAPTMRVERMLADAEEVVRHLRRTYGRRKIVLLGHSWGTVLGIELARRHPDWFYAYVGMSQFLDFQRSEALGYRATLDSARAAGNDSAVHALQAIAPFPDAQHPERTLANFGTERHWLAEFGGSAWHGSEGALDHVGRFSPDYSDADLANRDKGLEFSLRTLWPQLVRLSFLTDTTFACPVILMHGRHDLTTSATLVAQWFPRIRAPSKRLIWFDESSHLVYEEEPGKALAALVQWVLPLARER